MRSRVRASRPRAFDAASSPRTRWVRSGLAGLVVGAALVSFSVRSFAVDPDAGMGAAALPRLVLDEAGATVAPPRGFSPMTPSARAGRGVRAGWVREGVGVFLIVSSARRFDRAALADETRREIQGADAFAFRDRVETFAVLGASIEGLRGVGDVPSQESVGAPHRVVRFAVPIPLANAPVYLSATGALDDEAALRCAVVETLASVQGRSAIETPLRRALSLAAGLGLTGGVALTALYGIAALTLFRGRRRGWLRRLRGSALVLAGLAWSAPGVWALTSAGAGVVMRGFGALMLAFGAALVGHGGGLLRRPVEPEKDRTNEGATRAG